VVSLEEDPVGHLRLIQRGDQMALARGHLGEAERRARQGLAESESRGIGQAVFVFASDLVDIRMAQGGDTLAELRRLDRKASELFADIPPLNRPYASVAFYWAYYAQDADRAEHWWNLLRDATPDAVKSGRGFANDELYRRHWLAVLRGRPEEALEDLRELQRRQPCAVCRLRNVAFVFEALQQPDSAISSLERWVNSDDFDNVLGRETSLEAVLPELARLYEQVGRDQDAAATWRRFAERWADADDALQPRVERARARAATLDGGTG
jgi:tetratricopeptide (TPR) repeat protein